MTQAETAKRLHMTQRRVSVLFHGKIDEVRLDALVTMAHRLGLRVSMKVAA